MSNSKLNTTLKQLRRHKIEDIIHWSTYFSLSQIDYLKSFNMTKQANIFPWDIDSMLLIKVYIGTSLANPDSLNFISFQKLILSLSDYDYSKDFISQGRPAVDIVPIIAANQFTNQMDNRLLLYRSMFFYKHSSNLLSDLFLEKYGVDVEKTHQILFGIYGLSVAYKNEPSKLYDLISNIRQINQIEEVLKIYTIKIEELEELLKSKHQNPFELLHANYYLKQFCFLNINDTIYLVYPHNLLHLITYGTLYKLTDSSDETRNRFGKEILEDYLFHLCELNLFFFRVSKEVNYCVLRNQLKSSDVIVANDRECLFIESKSSVIRTSFRNPLFLDDENHYIKIYSENLHKLYKAMTNHTKGLYNLFGTTFELDNCCGLVVNLEDTHISRAKIFNAFFSIIISKQGVEISEELRQWAYSHLRVIDLYDFERVILTDNLSPIPKFFSNKWRDLTYSFDETETPINEVVAKNTRQLIIDFGELLFREYDNIT